MIEMVRDPTPERLWIIIEVRRRISGKLNFPTELGKHFVTMMSLNCRVKCRDRALPGLVLLSAARVSNIFSMPR